MYVPASAERFIAKAHTRGADAIILDLEDAVEEASKDRARAALSTAVRLVGQGGARVFVRVNNSVRLGDDARAAIAAGCDGIVLPKARNAGSIDALVGELAVADRERCTVIAIIEDAVGLLDARAIAAHSSVTALSLGAEDFATAIGGTPSPEMVRIPKLLVHYAAKAEGKISLGMLRSTADFTDHDSLAVSAKEAASFGFDGASCIHPKVVAVLNAGFSPTEGEITHARRVIAASAQAASQGQGAFMLDGQFVDEPVLQRARQVLAKAGEQP